METNKVIFYTSFIQEHALEENEVDFQADAFKRRLTPISDIVEEAFSPPFREVDVVGVVIKIDPELRNGFQAVFICDVLLNFVCLQFYGGIQKFGFSQVINKPGKVLLCSNLQWRDSSSKGNFFQPDSNRG